MSGGTPGFWEFLSEREERQVMLRELRQLDVLTHSRLLEEDGQAAIWGKKFCYHCYNPARS